MVFLPGESHGQRSLASYSPLGHKESDTTECLSTAYSIQPHGNHKSKPSNRYTQKGQGKNLNNTKDSHQSQ